MRIDNLIQSLRVLARADAMIAEAAFKARLSEMALRTAALLICVFGLVMIGLAAFFALEGVWGTIWAAVRVGVGSIALSGALVLLSSYRRRRPDLQIAHDMHSMALDSLVEEVRLAGRDLGTVRGLLRGAADGTLVGAIAPIIGLVLCMLKRSDTTTSSQGS